MAVKSTRNKNFCQLQKLLIFLEMFTNKIIFLPLKNAPLRFLYLISKYFPFSEFQILQILKNLNPHSK